MRIIPLLKVYEIRGHHLVDIAEYLHNPQMTTQGYLKRGYGNTFAGNQRAIFDDFISGRTVIFLIAGRLDATCLGDCQRFTTIQSGDQLPCEGGGLPTTEDERTARAFLLEIGKTYSFQQIERNLRNFYADQHSM
ncbi:MAG: hypothetical protein J4400_04240 [Candidatus Aenigmarchaeota archaeon]|nr:hypothetical protein [Candidatus Aenigmarchaeota archaeon]